MAAPDPHALLAHARWLRALARTLVADGAAADDLVQDTLVVALERGEAGDRPGPWYAGVLRNLARRRRRSDARRIARERGAATPERGSAGSGDALARAVLQRRLIGLVLELDEPYRTTLVLRFFDELSLEEIARRAGVPSSTARSRVARGLERLRARLDDEHAGDRGAWCAALAPLAMDRAGGTALGWGAIGMGMQARAAVAVGVVIAGALVWRGAGGGTDARPAEHARAATPDLVEREMVPGAAAETAGPRAPAHDPTRQPVAAAAAAAPELGALVYGSVLADDGDRIDDASIALVDGRGAVEAGSPGAPGTWSALGLAPGAYRVVARCDGFATLESELEIPPGVESQRHDLRLARTLEIPIRFVDESGARFDAGGVLRQTVRLAAVATLDPPPRVLPGVDGRDASLAGVGRYEGRSPFGRQVEGLGAEHDGILRLRVPPPVWVSAAQRNVVVATQRVEGPVDELVLRIPAAELRAQLGGVRLRLVDAQTGAPLTKGRVSLTDRQTGGGGMPIPADGRVELLGEAPGLRELEVRVGAHAVLHRRVRIPPGVEVDLGDVAVHPAVTVAGRVVDASGAPVATTLTWIPAAGTGMVQDAETSWFAASSADGSFALELPQSRVAILPRGHDEWAARPLVVDASNGDVAGVELAVTRGTPVRLRPPGPEAIGARFTLVTAEGLPFLSRTLYRDLPEEVRLAPGSYEVWFGWDEHVQARVPIDVPEGDAEALVVDLPPLEPAR